MKKKMQKKELCKCLFRKKRKYHVASKARKKYKKLKCGIPTFSVGKCWKLKVIFYILSLYFHFWKGPFASETEVSLQDYRKSKVAKDIELGKMNLRCPGKTEKFA